MKEARPMMASPSRGSTRSRWRSLPTELLHQSCKRVGIMSLTIAGIWAVAILMNNVVAPLMGHHHRDMMLGWHNMYPWPGDLFHGIGLATALGVYFMVPILKKTPKKLLRVAILLQIVTAALVALMMHWKPDTAAEFSTWRISWLCILIVTFPAVVPMTALTTLLVSLAVATMDPIAVWWSHLRGATQMADAFTMLWYFLPNYISVGLALVPATIIAGLGRQVSQARELGNYQLGELLGRGGMGEVYRAHHRLLARPAAIKLIRPETLGAGNVQAGSIMIQRFRREAQAAALLRSPHTISLYDFGVTDEGVFYYVMELLDGLDLESLVKRFGPVGAGRTAYMIRHACRSLGEAHTRGLVHRDVKPSNVFTCRLGLNVDFVKVLDFGLVKHKEGDEHAPTVLLTQPDVATGTPAFMAPEMALGEKTIDGRADIYALGCVAYWLLTGKLVFEADTPVKMMIQHIQKEPEAASRHTEVEVPAELDRLILKCLAKNPAERPQTMLTLADALGEIPFSDPWSKSRAEQWWEAHLPAEAPFTTLREETPVASIHAMK
ncbi:MAG: serine/threonine-protein kinase [Candidatus Eiseniibacteriota bacterium]